MTSAHEFEVPVHDLDAAGKAYSFPVRAAWLRGTFEGDDVRADGQDGTFAFRISKSGNHVIVHGHVQAGVTVPCARCLGPAPVAIDQQVSALMVPKSELRGSKGMDDEYEFDSEDANVLPYDGDFVVLDDLVRDELLLEIPMIPLCREDCPGISSTPHSSEATGTPEAEDPLAGIDPRLRPLLAIKLGRKNG
ncbi:MAG: DUF177 domain-containing protein [Polyangiaceae bacterium]